MHNTQGPEYDPIMTHLWVVRPVLSLTSASCKCNPYILLGKKIHPASCAVISNSNAGGGTNAGVETEKHDTAVLLPVTYIVFVVKSASPN